MATLKTLAKIALSLVVLLGCMRAYLWWQLHPVTRLSAYVQTKAKHWEGNPSLVAHFPSQIPADAREGKFYFNPKFLQGSKTMELRLGLPEKDILELLEKFAPLATVRTRGNAILDYSANNPDRFPMRMFHTFPWEEQSSPNPQTVLPGDFQMLLLSSRPYQTNPISWNHGDAAGICLSTNRNEVIYWAKSW